MSIRYLPPSYPPPSLQSGSVPSSTSDAVQERTWATSVRANLPRTYTIPRYDELRRDLSQSDDASLRRPFEASGYPRRHYSPKRALGAMLIEPAISPRLTARDADLETQRLLSRAHARHPHTLALGGLAGADNSLRQKMQRWAATVGGVIAAGLSVGLLVYFIRHHKAANPEPQIVQTSTLVRTAQTSKLP